MGEIPYPGHSDSGEKMDRQERIEAVVNSLNERIGWLTKEYDVTLTEMLGAIEVLKYNLMNDAFNEED